LEPTGTKHTEADIEELIFTVNGSAEFTDEEKDLLIDALELYEKEYITL